MSDTQPTSNQTTNFGFGQLGYPTPMWAKITFRVFALLTTVTLFIISGDPGIPDSEKVRIAVYLKGADTFILGVSQMFGISVDQK